MSQGPGRTHRIEAGCAYQDVTLELLTAGTHDTRLGDFCQSFMNNLGFGVFQSLQVAHSRRQPSATDRKLRNETLREGLIVQGVGHHLCECRNGLLLLLATLQPNGEQPVTEVLEFFSHLQKSLRIRFELTDFLGRKWSWRVRAKRSSDPSRVPDERHHILDLRQDGRKDLNAR